MKAKLTTGDRIELAIPFLIGLSLVFFLLFSSTNQDSETLFLKVFMIGLLGNFTHNFIFLWQLYRIPEYIQWRKEYRFHGLKFEWLVLGAFLFFWTLIRAVVPEYNAMKILTDWPPWQMGIRILLLTLNSHHSIAQTRGLSFRWSHRLHAQGVIDQPSATRKDEFVFSRLILIESVCAITAASMLKFKMDHLPVQQIRTFFFIALFGWLIWRIKKAEPQAFKIKATHYSRSLLRIAAPWTPVGLLGPFAQHGAEGMIIYWRMITNSESPAKKQLKRELATIFIVSTIFYPLLYYSNTNSQIFSELNYVVVAVILTHCVAEGFIFRFNNPVTRKNISALLK